MLLCHLESHCLLHGLSASAHSYLSHRILSLSTASKLATETRELFRCTALQSVIIAQGSSSGRVMFRYSPELTGLPSAKRGLNIAAKTGEARLRALDEARILMLVAGRCRGRSHFQGSWYSRRRVISGLGLGSPFFGRLKKSWRFENGFKADIGRRTRRGRWGIDKFRTASVCYENDCLPCRCSFFWIAVGFGENVTLLVYSNNRRNTKTIADEWSYEHTYTGVNVYVIPFHSAALDLFIQSIIP